MAAALNVPILRGTGYLARLRAGLRSLASRRMLLRLAGVEAVVIHGVTYAVLPVPLGRAREMVPALVRCCQNLVKWDIGEALYDDLIKVLALGLNVQERTVTNWSVALWDVIPVLDLIARVNGLQTVEAGASALGKQLAAWIGTSSTPGSSPAPAGRGSTSTNV